jgi:hypothetical protein
LYCSTCGDDRLFERPPCRDGHGADCPERVCTGCGAAVLIGLPPGSAGAPAAPAVSGPARPAPSAAARGGSSSPAAGASAAAPGSAPGASASGRAAYQRAVA